MNTLPPVLGSLYRSEVLFLDTSNSGGCPSDPMVYPTLYIPSVMKPNLDVTLSHIDIDRRTISRVLIGESVFQTDQSHDRVKIRGDQVLLPIRTRTPIYLDLLRYSSLCFVSQSCRIIRPLFV